MEMGQVVLELSRPVEIVRSRQASGDMAVERRGNNLRAPQLVDQRVLPEICADGVAHDQDSQRRGRSELREWRPTVRQDH